jgi:general secretion pathway protein F/type IV pilus assembly protein PilC
MALEEKHRGEKTHIVLLDLLEKVRSGQSLASALANHPATFDVLYLAIIANAEKTGRLAESFQELATLMAKQSQLRQQFVSAMIYPLILAGFCMVVLSTLLLYVIPSLKELFEDRQVHGLTRFVFACSDALVAFKLVSLSIFTAFATLLFLSFYIEKWKVFWKETLVRLPGLRSLSYKAAMVRFFRAFAVLLEGGVSILDALKSARSVAGHKRLEAIATLAQQQLSEGKPLFAAFEHQPLIPSLVPRMIAIAQQGGRLSFMTKQIAEIYEEELNTALARLSSMAQPILLLVLGGIIGLVLLAVLLPLTDVSSFIGN